MSTETLWVPFTALNDTVHNGQTRLVWLLGLASGVPSTATDASLREGSGLDGKTIAAARTKLNQAPLAACSTRPQRSCAAMPRQLLTNRDISASARLLYGQLQGLPDFGHPSGSFTYASLSRLTGNCDDALRRAVRELVATGWLTTTQASRKSPLCFTLRNPVSTQLRARIFSVRRRVRGAQHRGETLLYEFLNGLIALDDFKDNAALDVLSNPYTGELMELDRYYPSAGVAVEFNGDQHYEENDLTTFGQTVKQVGRDAMKAFIRKARRIELIIIHSDDLTLKAIDQKIPKRLPRRHLEGMEPLIAALEELATEYRERRAEERARKGPRSARSTGG